jgi:hypothetical protein
MALPPNRKAIAREMALVNHPATALEHSVLVELLEQLHAAGDPADLVALHTKLLARYLRRQRLRDELKAAKSEVAASIAKLAAQVPRDVGRCVFSKRGSSRSITTRSYSWRSPHIRARSRKGPSGRLWPTTAQQLPS